MYAKDYLTFAPYFPDAHWGVLCRQIGQVMGIKRAIVMAFLNDDLVHKPAVAGLLYGKIDRNTRNKFTNKLTGRDNRDFSDEEIEKLYEIRKAFLQRQV